MENLQTRRIKEFVTEDYRTASVFERYSIDFCCNGKKTLNEACAEKGIDPAQVIGDIQTLNGDGAERAMRFSDWEPDALTDFIVNHHHRFVRQAVPALLQHTQKVAMKHGDRHPEAIGIAHRFSEVADELARHMAKEEMILFPYIKKLVQAKRDGQTLPPPPFGTIENPIRAMEAEHDSAGDALHFIREASQGFTPPPDACMTYRVSYQELAEFERDLHHHVHLENNILFPAALRLEEEVLAAS